MKPVNYSNFYINIFYAIISAILLKLTFPPFYLEPLGFIALIPILIAIKYSTPKESFYLGLTFGLIFFSTLLWWIIPTISHYGDIPIICSTAILGCLVVYLSLYPAIWAYICSKWIFQKDTITIVDILNICSLWVVLEWLRGHLLTGFPWGILGCSLINCPTLIQTASFLGMYWISFWVMLINCLLSIGIFYITQYKNYLKSTSYLILTLIILSLFWGSGKYLIKETKKLDSKYPQIEAVAIQGNIPQDKKWSSKFQNDTFNQYRKLTISAIDKIKILKANRTKHLTILVVWPETAMPFFFQDPSTLREKLLDLAKASHCLILFGAPAYKILPDGKAEKINIKYFNSAFLVSPTGIVLGRYDKEHLVPFGEYLPFGYLTSWARKLIGSIGAFSAGTKPNPLCWHNIKIGVLICFESIFPKIARQFIKNGTNLLTVITDDAWFGNTSAPYEHADMSVFRAVETRRYIIRAANTGESLFITPWGEKLENTPLFKATWIAKTVRLRSDITLYDKIGDNWIWPFLLPVIFNLLKSQNMFTIKRTLS